MIREIWKLRQDESNPLAALDAALAAFDRELQQTQADEEWIHACWHEHFAGSSCLLLEFARQTWSTPREQLPRFQRLEQLLDRLKEYLPKTVPLLQTRLNLLRTICQTEKSVRELTAGLRRATEDYAGFFASPGVSYSGESAEDRAAFLQRLPDGARWMDVFAELAKEFGWRNPGLQMVGETVGGVYGRDEAAADDHSVQTWILLADVERPNGVLARLRLRRLDGGCGGLFADPSSAGYTRLDESFRTGLFNAWTAAFGNANIDFDVAWSLELVNADYQLRQRAIGGRSAEAAVCCGLRALNARERLDQHIAITAKLAAPGEAGTHLGEVGAIDKKTTPLATLKLKKITEILVAADQPEIRRNHGREIAIGNDEIRLTPVADVDQAYQHLARWERITSHARKQLAAAADGLLQKLCGSYVIPSLSRPAPRDPATSSVGWTSVRPVKDQSTADASDEPLEPHEVAQLLGGQLPHPRTLLLAHSGLGKSVLLIECQRQMATRPTGPLLVRFGGLSEFPWNDPPAVRRRMADELAAYLPPGVKEPERWQWFERLVDAGQAIFLLDALDQTIVDKLDGMRSFLANGIGDCPVLMTGRPYVTETRHTVLNSGPEFDPHPDRRWSQLRLDKFDETQQRQFLGEWAAEVLVTKEEQDRPWDFEESIARKRQWADLVDQPLLLKMLRDLALAKNLRDVRNRHDIYQAAVRQLIDKGLNSLRRSESRKIFQSDDDVQRVLRLIAWKRAQAGDFRGVVAGVELVDLMTDVAQVRKADEWELQNALDQINVVTCGGIVESGQEIRLAWRHFSFCEYFAGLELARDYPRRRMTSPPGGPRCDRQPENEYAAAVQSNARSEAWHSVFRFALSYLAAENQHDQLVALAKDLIQSGNPFVVADAIRADGIRLPDDLDRLCRWLVHRELHWRELWTDDDEKPEIDSETAALLDSAFVLRRRDSRYLHAAWELVSGSDLDLAKSVGVRFLGEFPQLLQSGNPIAIGIRDGFQEIPPREDALRQTMRFPVGPSEGEKGDSDEGTRRFVKLKKPFEMARTPVTNALFELFAPDHAERRTEYSVDADCPVVEVTWYEAALFCVWLGSWGEGRVCRLPTETEWEIACRAGSEGPYCRIKTEGGEWRDLVSEDDLRLVAHFKSQTGTLPVASRRQPNAWGLYDMLGNVWEWCADWYDPKGPTNPSTGSARSDRGGSWGSRPWFCRSAYRNRYSPSGRSFNLGFRVARSSVSSSPLPSSQERSL